MKIYDLIPDAEVLIELAPEELAFHLLQVADANLQNGIVNREAVVDVSAKPGSQPPYGQLQGLCILSLLETT